MLVPAILIGIALILLVGAAAARQFLLGLAGMLLGIGAVAYLGFISEINPMVALLVICLSILAGAAAWRLIDPAGFAEFEEMRKRKP